MERHRFASTALFMWSGLLIWMTNFLFAYVFTAVACAKGFADLRVLGWSIVPAVATISSAIAGVATAVLMWVAWRGRKAGSRTDEGSRFIRFVASAAGALALVAIAFVALPPLLTSVSCR